MGNALHTKGAGTAGVTGADESRLADGGLLGVGSGGLISTRTGVMAGPGSQSLVTGTSSTSPLRYSVAANHWVTNRGVVSDGVYRGAAETTKLVDTTAAPASGSRVDVIWVKQNDAGSTISADATSAPVYGCTQGTSSTGTPAVPTIPIGAEELARATVLAGATRTDDGTKVTVTNTARQVTARGGITPVRANDTEAGTHIGVYRDHPTLGLQRWDGTAWKQVYLAPLLRQAVSATASWASPNGGQIATAITIDPTAMFGPGIGARVMLDGAALVDVASGSASDWYYNLFRGDGQLLGQDYRQITGRHIFRSLATVDVPAGAVHTFYPTLTAPGIPANQQVIKTYADFTSNRLNANIFPLL